MKNQNQTIIIIGILLVLAIFVLPKLDLFAILPPEAIVTTDDSYTSEDRPTYIRGGGTSIRVGFDASGDEYRSYLKFRLDNDFIGLVRAGEEIETAELHLYIDYADRIRVNFHELTNDWDEDSLKWNNQPGYGDVITGVQIYSTSDEEPLVLYGFENYIKEKILAGENSISIAIISDHFVESKFAKIYSKEKSGSYHHPHLILELAEEVFCTENEIKQFEDIYYICRNQEWRKVIDIIDLSDEEQARLMDIINQLELTIEQKAEIIQNLTTTLEGQLIMIDQLEVLTAEKAQIIIQLELNIEEQAILITEMELTVAEQAIIIEQLDLTIQEQADLINQMQINLALKAELIQLLQVENEQQAELIAAMKLSFAEQADIINALENLIGDDAEIILALYDTIDEQAQLIIQLKLTRDELAELITAMGLTISENADLINQLQLTTEEQLVIIANLELSLEQEKTLVEQLKITIEQQKALIEDLKDYEPTIIKEFDLKDIWENYKILIIGGGIILLLLLLADGGKRR